MLSVLIVESHDDSRDLYTEFLRFAGFRVCATDNSDDAQALAATADAVVTETRVFGSLDGLGLVRWLRGNAATNTLPVIVISASAFPADAEGAKAAGCTLFLSKPCLPADLATEIRHAVLDRTRATPARLHGDRRHVTRCA